MKRRFDMKKSVLPEQEQQEELVVEEPQQKKGHIFVVATFFAKSTHTIISYTSSPPQKNYTFKTAREINFTKIFVKMISDL